MDRPSASPDDYVDEESIDMISDHDAGSINISIETSSLRTVSSGVIATGVMIYAYTTHILLR